MSDAMRPAVVRVEECYYKPGKIAYWLMHWDDLTVKAERIGSINVHLNYESTKHIHLDPMHWANVQGDILSAWNTLGPETQMFKLIYLVIFGRWEHERYEFARDHDWQSYVITNAGSLLHPIMCPMAAGQLYWNAVREMARGLGWTGA